MFGPPHETARELSSSEAAATHGAVKPQAGHRARAGFGPSMGREVPSTTTPDASKSGRWRNSLTESSVFHTEDDILKAIPQAPVSCEHSRPLDRWAEPDSGPLELKDQPVLL